MALAGLHQVGGRRRSSIVGGTGEGVCAGAVREVIEPAAADVGDVDAETELLLSAGVGGEVGAVEMVFRAAGVGLRAARGKQSGDRDLCVRGRAGD
jgi:hypothetical protein